VQQQQQQARLALVNAALPSDGITAMFTGCVHQQHTYVVPVLWLCTAVDPLRRVKGSSVRKGSHM
jgi:hypothetical protein